MSFYTGKPQGSNQWPHICSVQMHLRMSTVGSDPTGQENLGNNFKKLVGLLLKRDYDC
jgi:hypothetical protein